METAKWVTLATGNSQMLEMDIHEVGKGLVRTVDLYQKRMESADKEKDVIYGLGWIWLE